VNIRVLEAIHFAAVAHDGQYRKGPKKVPYICHPLEVAKILIESGEDREAVIVAAILHDTVEDCGVTLEQIARKFGDEVAGLVGDLTNPEDWDGLEGQCKEVAKVAASRPEIGAIKVADKTSTLRDLVRNPPPWEEDRYHAYVDFSRRILSVSQVNHRLARAFFVASERAGAA